MHDDFRVFLWYIWRHLGLPDPTPIQYDIAAYLQAGPKRRIIEGFRGVGKSFITAAFVLWLLWRNPAQERVMVVSANEDRAVAFGTFVRNLIEQVDILNVLRPKDGQRDSVKAFDVGPAIADQAPSVRCIGVTGQMTGGRATTIIADDVEVPRNALTEREREKLAEAVKEFDAILKPGGQIVYLGTPQVAQSLYNTLQTRGYALRVWPVRYPKESVKYKGTLAPLLAAADVALAGKSTEPSRFSDIDLAEREASYGRSGFALQFMLDTSLSDADKYALKINELIVMDVDSKRAPVALTWASGTQQVIPDMPNVGFNGDRYHAPMYASPDYMEYQGAVMHIDPSGRGKDETAYAVTKMLKGMIYVTRWGGLKDGYSPAVLETLARIAQEQGVKEVLTEDNYADGMFGALIAPVFTRIYPVTITGYKVAGQKEVRIINDLEPVLNQHRLVMDKGVILADYKEVAEGDPSYSGLYQLSHLTKDRGSLKHDDRLDVLSSSVRYWTKMILNDTSKAEAEYKDKQLDLAVKAFYKGNLGMRPPKKVWNRLR
jgi:hypothetical protein